MFVVVDGKAIVAKSSPWRFGLRDVGSQSILHSAQGGQNRH